jgi:N-acetylglucosamine-6-phosphate deacetylase
LILSNALVLLQDRVLREHAVIVESGKIVDVLPGAGGAFADSDDLVDCRGGYLAPGYIDLHTHGLHQLRVDDGPDHLLGLCETFPKYGVTGFLPTVLPRPKGEDAVYVASLARCVSEGSQILGLHLEGPFLALPGAMPPSALGKADPERVLKLIDAARPLRAIFSVSPDFEGILDLIPLMARNGTPVFATHTAAGVEQTQAAIDAGVRHATHFYDVFPCPSEKDPGVRPCGAVEAILADPRVSVDFILDGEHVHPVAVKLALKCKGPDGVSLITDSNVGAGLAPGVRYHFAGYDIIFEYDGGPARMTEDSPIPGGLAGSGLTLDRAVRNAVRLLGIDVPMAVRMASLNPAAVLGLDDSKGRIAQGYDADLVLLDGDLKVLRTWIGGVQRYP